MHRAAFWRRRLVSSITETIKYDPQSPVSVLYPSVGRFLSCQNTAQQFIRWERNLQLKDNSKGQVIWVPRVARNTVCQAGLSDALSFYCMISILLSFQINIWHFTTCFDNIVPYYGQANKANASEWVSEKTERSSCSAYSCSREHSQMMDNSNKWATGHQWVMKSYQQSIIIKSLQCTCSTGKERTQLTSLCVSLQQSSLLQNRGAVCLWLRDLYQHVVK